MREHGTRARYVHGPGPGSDRAAGCRCESCTEANRSYARERDRAARRPDVAVNPAYIDAKEVRLHLRWLARRGVGKRSVHLASGVALSSVERLRSGSLTRCRRDTAERLLLVFPVDAADHALIGAAPTWRLLNDLLAHGYTRTDLARRLGSRAKVPALQLGHERVTAANARKVKALHQSLMLPVLLERRYQADRKAFYRSQERVA